MRPGAVMPVGGPIWLPPTPIAACAFDNWDGLICII
jgi:hypothetical protein